MMEGYSLKLATKNTYDGKIDFGNGNKLKIDYPSLRQESRMNGMLMEVYSSPKAKQKALMYEYAKYYNKCTIKDWELKIENAPKCILQKDEYGDTELNDELWLLFSVDVEQTMKVYNRISDELKADELTKKK